MKKGLYFLLVFVLMASSCVYYYTNVHDMKKKIESGDRVHGEIYDFPIGEVFDAVAFVLRHSEDKLIARVYKMCDYDFGRESKMILCKDSLMISIGIFFEPQGRSKTKVTFVQDYRFDGKVGRTRVARTFDEAHFFLENGEEAYLKYTHEESLRTRKLYKSKWGIP